MTSRCAAAAALILTAGLNACASASATTAGGQRDKVVDVTDNSVRTRPEATLHEDLSLAVPPDSVFAALKAAYADLGIEVKYSNPGTGEIGNLEFVRMHRLAGDRITDFVNCGSGITGPAADNYRITMLLVSTVKAEGTGSRVETRFQARGVDSTQGVSAPASQCQSLGTLEQKLHNALKEKLGV